VPPTWIVRVVEKSVKMAAAVCLLVPKMMIAQAAMESHAAKSKLASALRA
jgi:flagellum-specific peptidoglycan hydrolase FlgJ